MTVCAGYQSQKREDTSDEKRLETRKDAMMRRIKGMAIYLNECGGRADAIGVRGTTFEKTSGWADDKYVNVQVKIRICVR